MPEERPNLASVLRCPVTAGLAMLAVGVTLWKFTGRDYSALVVDGRAFHFDPWEPWRLATAILPHADPIHLLFNLYWLWEFGAVVERRWGSLRFAAIVLFLAAGSTAAEYAAFIGGIGLSGVGYGLFGLLWVLGRRSREWDGVLQQRTVQLFVVWFFVCILMTATGAFPVANVAHGMGAALGALLGVVVTSRGAERAGCLAATALLVTAIGVAATVARPVVNLSPDGHSDLFQIAYDAYAHGDKARALRWYERAARMRSADAPTWYNLGIAYHALGRIDDAVVAYEEAHRLKPASAEYRRTLAEWKMRQGYDAQTAGDLTRAESLYRRAVELHDDDPLGWYNLGTVYDALGRAAEAERAYARAKERQPASAPTSNPAETQPAQ